MLNHNSHVLLSMAHPKLIELCLAVEKKGIAFRITCSYRSNFDQQKKFDAGLSKARPGQSAHNYTPSAAIDFAPGWEGPINWKDGAGFDRVAKAFVETAHDLKIPIRWGGDWDGDGKTSDERFVDRPHIELHPSRNYVKEKPK